MALRWILTQFQNDPRWLLAGMGTSGRGVILSGQYRSVRRYLKAKNLIWLFPNLLRSIWFCHHLSLLWCLKLIESTITDSQYLGYFFFYQSWWTIKNFKDICRCIKIPWMGKLWLHLDGTRGTGEKLNREL